MHRVVGLLLLLPAMAMAGDNAKKQPMDQYQALVKQYNEQMDAFREAVRSAKTPQQRQQAFLRQPKTDKFAPKFLSLARKHPRTPAARESTTWVVGHASSNKFRGQALGILRRDWIKDAKVGPACMAATDILQPQAEPFLRAVLAKNPNHDAQATACLALANYLKDRVMPAVENIKDRPASATRYANELGKGFVQRLRQLRPAKLDEEADALYERAIREYGDVEVNGQAVASVARPELFELRHLTIGKSAPDITGEDIDGKTFKLSDYRGKVVLLDFWGNW